MDNQDPTDDPIVEANDIAQNKLYAALSYVGILVLVPIFLARESKFAQFHAGQGVILLVITIIVNAVGAVLPVVGSGLVLPLGNLIVILYSLVGIVNALQGKERKLPLIGQFNIL